MARGVLCALLLALGCALGQAGEYCHGWSGGAQRWHRGFQCPERSDGPLATLCCGSCSLRYCCSAPESRLDQGRCPGEPLPSPRTPVPVPVYLPFLLVGSVFVAFVVGGACVGICCCKCFKSRAEGQQSGLAPGQTWLLEPDVPSGLPSSALRGSLGSAPPSSICTALPPPVPVLGLAQNPRFFSPPCTSAQLSHPSRALHGIPRDHMSVLAPAPFLKRTIHGHGAEAALGVAQGKPGMFSAVHV
ncbi:PREDICTED: protein shisa-1-like [Lepidothrix coronata]|uniref:Protein shisa-1-like n=1 Tax=Lepidothrix coronata TaxID=321398 RepID=A0A6J0H6C3_9PASS|nr:PREDICTED: protein shisa-1-like [Lepidothrix coronata]